MNRKALLAVFAVIVLGIIVAGVGFAYLHQAAPRTPIIDIPSIPSIIGSSGPYVLAASLPDVNDSYPVYLTVTPKIAPEEIRHIGDLFGLSGAIKDPLPSSSKIRIVDDSKNPPAELSYYMNSGAFRYDIPEKVYPYSTDRQPDLPSDEEARVIATNYLKERDLLPDDVHVEGVSVGSQFERKTLTSYTVYDLTKNVEFVKELQGVRVYNAGITVTIGENGEVVSAGSSLRELNPEPVRYVKILTPEQAYQRLISGDVVMKPLTDGYDKIVVSSISLGYWMEIKTDPQKYVLPVYVFSCATPSGAYRQYVPAVDPSEVQYLT